MLYYVGDTIRFSFQEMSLDLVSDPRGDDRTVSHCN